MCKFYSLLVVSMIVIAAGATTLGIFHIYNVYSPYHLELCSVENLKVSGDTLEVNLLYKPTWGELYDDVIISNSDPDKYKVGNIVPCIVYWCGIYGKAINRTNHKMIMGNIYVKIPFDPTLLVVSETCFAISFILIVVFCSIQSYFETLYIDQV